MALPGRVVEWKPVVDRVECPSLAVRPDAVRVAHERVRVPVRRLSGDRLLGNRAVMVWGEGHNYVGGPSNPGHVIYRSMLT
jgi:hypothetical protein